MDNKTLIKLYDLEPHPEGGYYKESYRSSYSTAIYFLLGPGQTSKLHRIKSDEMWHFYLGGPLALIQISPEGALKTITLGQDAAAGERLQHVVPSGFWFGAYPKEGSAYSFVGCTVSPAFNFSDLEMAKREELLKQFPHATAAIKRLTD